MMHVLIKLRSTKEIALDRYHKSLSYFLCSIINQKIMLSRIIRQPTLLYKQQMLFSSFSVFDKHPALYSAEEIKPQTATFDKMNYDYFRYVKKYTTGVLNFEGFSLWLRVPLVKFTNERDPSQGSKETTKDKESLGEKIVRKGAEIKENIKEDYQEAKKNVKQMIDKKKGDNNTKMSYDREHTEEVTRQEPPHTRKREILTEEKIAQQTSPQDLHKKDTEKNREKKSETLTHKSKVFCSSERHNPDEASCQPAFPKSDRNDSSASERKGSYPTSDSGSMSSSAKPKTSDPTETIPPSPRTS